MPAEYKDESVQFQYPENWKLTQNEPNEWPREISLESPGGAIWTMHVSDCDSSPRELLDQAVDALSEQYDSLEVSSVSTDFDGFQSEGVEVDFYCLDFLITAQVHAITTERLSFVFLFQAESRDFAELDPVLRAITISVMSTQKQVASG